MTHLPKLPVAVILLALGISLGARAAEHPVPLEKGVQDAKCLECHGNDASRSALTGNTGAVGPHSSGQIHILERSYTIEAYNSPERTASAAQAVTKYGTCNKCHDVSRLYNSHTFKGRNHIGETACATCHNPHAATNPQLIDFDLRIVGPNGGAITFDKKPNGGSCTLSCHGSGHSNRSYNYNY